jgi:hypothetical protein
LTGFLCIGCNNGTSVLNLKPLSKKQIAKIYNSYLASEFKKKSNLIDKPFIDIDEENICIKEASNFKNLYCVGSFAHDRGCMGDLIIAGNIITSWKNIMPDVLNVFGWKKEENRLALSLNWVENDVLCWERVIHEKENDIGTDYNQPISEKQGNDYRVVLWLAAPAGMRKGKQFERLEIIIDNNGNLKSKKILEKKSIDF